MLLEGLYELDHREVLTSNPYRVHLLETLDSLILVVHLPLYVTNDEERRQGDMEKDVRV